MSDKINPIKTNLPDGVFSVRNGKAIEIESFTWGYQGVAPCGHSSVSLFEGKVVLSYSPGNEPLGQLIRNLEDES